MAKLTRRQRRELTSNPKKQKKKVASGSVTRENYVPRKMHTCIFHKYEEQDDGTFICLICGHHFDRKMDEAELRRYLYFRKDYSLKELREMDSHILEVTYGKDTRGVSFEFDARELSGWDAVNKVCEISQYFRCVENNLQFVQEDLMAVDFRYNLNVSRGYSGENQWVPTYDQLESIFDETSFVDIEEFWNTEKEWCYKTLDGKMHWYRVYPVLNGWLVEFPGLYYVDADLVAARKYVFSKDGNLERVVIRLWNERVYSLRE